MTRVVEDLKGRRQSRTKDARSCTRDGAVHDEPTCRENSLVDDWVGSSDSKGRGYMYIINITYNIVF